MKKPAAFSLIEILVVLVIIVVIAALLFPVIGAAKEKARETDEKARLKQVALAINIYQADNDQFLPPTLKKLGLPYQTTHCVKSGMEFYYPLNYSFIKTYGRIRDVVPEFEPSQDSVVKAMFWHDFDCGWRNHNCDTRTFTDPVTHQAFAYTTPTSLQYKVLAGFLDGHVAFVPATEGWERNHIKTGDSQ